MRLIGLAVALTVSLILAPLAAEAQQTGKVYRVGVLGIPAGWSELQQGLEELGYVEGRNIVYLYRSAEGDSRRYPRALADLVGLHVDVIVTPGSAPRAAKEAPTAIPIVIATGGDLVGEGIVASLAHPGGNITGLGAYPRYPNMAGKEMQLLKEAVPKASRMAYLFEAGSRNFPLWQPELELAAQSLGWALRWAPVRSAPELDAIFAQLAKDRVGAVVAGSGVFEFVHRRQIIDLAAQYRLPIMFNWRAGATDGGLMSYGASLADMHRRSATYVDKILKGAKPADLPIEQATKFELVINLKTAKALGLTIPQTLLLQADQVIE